MFENEEEVMDDIIEDATVEQPTTEQDGEIAPVQQDPAAEPEKVYTEEDFKKKLEEALDKKAPRMEARIRKEYERKYGELENVLRAGTGKDNVTEMASDFRQYYEGRGVQIPKSPAYSDRDTEILAKAEAEDIIESGLEEVIIEADRLAKIGYNNLNPRDKAVFRKLSEYRQEAERVKELSAIGVTKEVYEGKEFRDFAAKFDAKTPVTEIYEYFNKMQPKKEVKPPESMKSTVTGKETVKDFYTFEEASKFTVKDFEKNPALYKAVEASMRKW